MGRPSKSSVGHSSALVCNYCGNSNESDFYVSKSLFYQGHGKIPYCRKCIDNLYTSYVLKYKNENCTFPERKAIKRLCMAFDLYFSDDVFESAVKSASQKTDTTLIASYIRIVRLAQYSRKGESYDTTLSKEEAERLVGVYVNFDGSRKVSEDTVRFFGGGFSDEDYMFLQNEYDDWTARHECKTKVQEEVFKRICFKQLELLKATRAKQDTKDLDATFQKLLETANLQPKQNTKDAVSDAQVFGTLIDKWENTRPLPDIDEQLKDVDKIGIYLDVFFRGHLSKMMGIKNAFSNLYTNFMKKYTVQKPEYDSDENSEVIFDAIFGNHDSE